MAAFEAIALAKALGTKVGVSKIVHGNKRATFSIKASTLSRGVHRKVSQVSALLSATSPPELILNRHCPECGFQDRCRKNAVEKDDLSLLSHLTDKERARFRSKGIFTVSQLAYTFRSRRRSKRLASRPEKYHHALKALAIREHKTHIVGNMKLAMEGTPIFLDVEGLPDRDFIILSVSEWKNLTGQTTMSSGLTRRPTRSVSGASSSTFCLTPIIRCCFITAVSKKHS